MLHTFFGRLPIQMERWNILVFDSLSQQQLAAIVDIQLDRLRQLLSQRDIRLTLTPEARLLLAERGYDPQFGARPLKRALQRYLQDPLAMAFLSGQFQTGDRIEAQVADGEISFRRLDDGQETQAA